MLRIWPGFASAAERQNGLYPEFRTPMSKPDLERVAALLRDVADREILPRFRTLRTGDIRAKTGPADLVTEADIAAEQALTPALAELVPGSRVIGEEAAEHDKSLFAHLAGEAPVWLVDPVDGTYNFAHGQEGFCVMVAYVERGVTRAAWIYEPLSRQLAWAEEGSGAYLDRTRLQTRAAGGLSDMVGVAHFASHPKPAMRERLTARRAAVGRNHVLGSAGLEYVGLCTGERQFGIYTRLKPWDHVPGTLLVREAGGHVAFLESGSAYLPRGVVYESLLSAADADSWDKIRAAYIDEPAD
jgi:fructose-1,6-bisphosphatase/inositol monophosphatase family enzyme